MQQQRFMLALILSAGILIVWQSYFAPAPPKRTEQIQKSAAESSDRKQTDRSDSSNRDGRPAETGSQSESGRKAAARDSESAPPNKADRDDRKAVGKDSGSESVDPSGRDGTQAPERDVDVATHTMRTDKFKAVFTNKGGRATSVRIISSEQYKKRGDLVGFPESARYYPFEVHFTRGNFEVPDNPVFRLDEEASKKDGDDSYERLVYRYEDPNGRFSIDKIFKLSKDKDYVIDLTYELRNELDNARLVDVLALDLFGWKDPNEESSSLNFRPNNVEGVCHFRDDTERSSITSIEEPLRYDDRDVVWGAVDTRYFMLAGVPAKGAEQCSISKIEDNYLRTRVAQEEFSLAPDSTFTFEAELFAGPKDVDVLHEVGSALEASVDYGIFSFLARPLRWGLNYIQGWVGNWGLAILILTIIIRLLITPINIKAYTSMEKMKQIQPELEEIREKYDDDQQRMTEETMKLFRENDVSPLGGCLPMLLQMPILYALYVMIYNSVELYHADFVLWYHNLAAPDPYYVLPLMMGIAMFFQQKMSSSTMGGQNQQAAIMMKVMPVVMTGFMIFLPAGLVLYYAMSLIIGVGQQYYIKQTVGND